MAILSLNHCGGADKFRFHFLDYFRYLYKPNTDEQNDGFEVHIICFNLKKKS